MNWYVAKIVYQIICGSGNHTPQFDEQIRLLAAPDEATALAKASQIGRNEEEVFCNNKQEMVHWKFIDVTELYCFNQELDGAEVWSRISEVDDADSYIHFLRLKSAALREQMEEGLLTLI
jgi:hypothetical protein